MNLWRRTRTELAGAWRSVRYDMGHRPAEPAEGPDVTSTGMSTFAGAAPIPEQRRRLVAVSAFGVLAVAGAAGAYFVVDGGLVAGKPAEAQPYPLAAAAPPADDSSTAGMGQGPASVGRPAADAANAPAVDPVASVAAPAPLPSRGLPRVSRVTPERAKPPAPQPCACPTSPVPTPTQPSESPSASPSPSPSPSESPSPSASASPSTSASAEALMRRSYRRDY
jgi:hypothetical protein